MRVLQELKEIQEPLDHKELSETKVPKALKVDQVPMDLQETKVLKGHKEVLVHKER